MKVLYRERPGNLRLWLGVPWTAWAALMLWMIVNEWTEHGELSLDAYAILGPLFLLIFSIPGLTSYSKRRYHSITLTEETLRVGRETVRTADIDPGPHAEEGAEPARVRLMGGAYDVPLGMDSVVIKTRQGDYLQIATRHPERLSQALNGLTVQGRP